VSVCERECVCVCVCVCVCLCASDCKCGRFGVSHSSKQLLSSTIVHLKLHGNEPLFDSQQWKPDTTTES